MADDNSGQRIPSTETLMGWADRYGLEHPVTSDTSGRDANSYVITGYPTYVLIDREMTIANPDMWPFSDSAVEQLLAE